MTQMPSIHWKSRRTKKKGKAYRDAAASYNDSDGKVAHSDIAGIRVRTPYQLAEVKAKDSIKPHAVRGICVATSHCR